MDFSGWLDDIFDAITSNKKVDPSEMHRFKDTSHKLDAEEIDAIKQQNSKGFTIYDIDPNRLQRSEFACVYTPDVLLRLTGYETNSNFSNPVDGGTATTNTFTVNPYWRSVYIDKPGTFLKIEFLEPRYSDIGEINYYTSGGVDNQANIWPQNSIINTSVRPFPNLGVASAKRKIFLDFENPTANPIEVKSGDCFKTYFSGFWLTFKQLNTRIRVTIGYNSEIVSNEEKPSNLYLWRGPGFLDNSSFNPVPFSITQENFDPSVLSFSGGIGRLSLIQNLSDFNTPEEGLSVGWITGFNLMFTPPSSGSTFFDINYDLYKCRVNSFNVIIDDLQRLCGGTQKVKGTNGGEIYDSGCVLNQPVRFTLRPNEVLALRIRCSNSGTQSFGIFNVMGYMCGSFQVRLQEDASPFFTTMSFKDHPYPNDLDNNTLPF